MNFKLITRLLCIAIIVASFAWQYFMMPSDYIDKDHLFHLWLAAAIFFMVLSPEFLNNFRPEDSSEQSPKIVVFIVFSLFVAGGVFGAIYLPVVILFPFIALFVLLFTPVLQVGVFDDYIFYGLFTTVIGKLIKAGVVILVLFWCFSSITEIQRIYALRNIEPDTIQLIKFSNGQRTENM